MSPKPARRVPKQARAKEKVARIVAAARAVLEESGPEGFNTNAVAKRAGVGIGSVYEYFPNKQAIVDHMIEDLSASETDAVLAGLASLEGRGLRDLVSEMVTLVSGMYRTNHMLYRALWALSKSPREVGHRPAEQAVMEQTARLLAPHAEALGIEDVELACFTVFHLVESLADQLAGPAGARWDANTSAAEITKVVVRYLGIRDPAH